MDELQLRRLRYFLSQAHERQEPTSLFRRLFRKPEKEPPVPQELGQLLLKPVKPRRENDVA